MLPVVAGGTLFQIGMVVPDLERAVARFTETLGLGPWIGFHFSPENVQDFTYRGRPADYSMDVALTGEGPQLELIQVHGERTLYHEWIDEHGYGVQHLATRVDSHAAAMQQLLGAGYELLQSGHGYGADGDGGFAYFDTRAELGVILEVLEVPRVRRDPDYTWPRAPG